MTFCNALKFFSSAPVSGGEAAGRVRLLLSCLGNPERKLRILPVAGDKGKSSVVRMLSGIMACSGIGTVSVIYPTLSVPKDNIFLGERNLTNEEFISYTASLSAAVRRMKAKEAELSEDTKKALPPLSRDELLFCLAVLIAAERNAKWLILEIPSTAFSPISTVRFSAAVTVFTSCEKIPPHAASLIHSGLSEVVSAPSGGETYPIILNACAKAGCRLAVPASLGVEIPEASLRRTVFVYRKREFSIPLYGDFSITNALTALATADALRRIGCPITEKGETEGLLHASLPARAEFLSVSPTILTDAANTPFSLAALRTLLEKKGPSVGGRIVLCTEDGDLASDALLPLREHGFTFSDRVIVQSGKENRTAQLLLKQAEKGDLILAVGAFPFAYTMRTEFLKVLKSI